MPLSFTTSLSASARVVLLAEVEPSTTFSSAVVEVTPSRILSSAVVDVTPSKMFSSVAVDVTPSKIFNSAAVDVTPSRIFNSAAVAVTAVLPMVMPEVVSAPITKAPAAYPVAPVLTAVSYTHLTLPTICSV